MVFKPAYTEGLAGARGTVSWMIKRGMAMLKYTTVVMSVTAIGANEKGLVQFIRAIPTRKSDPLWSYNFLVATRPLATKYEKAISQP